jgi:PAS domain S-box-containing protein
MFYYVVNSLKVKNEKLLDMIMSRDKHLDEVKKENSQLERKYIQISEELKSTNRILLKELERTLSVEKELVNTDKKFRLLIENINDAVIITRNDRLLFSNKQFADLLGYSPLQLKNMKTGKFFTREAEEISDIHRNQIAIGEEITSNYETKFRRSDGTEIYFEANSKLIKLGDSRALFTVLKNITDKVKVNEELSKTIERNNALLESIPDIMFIIDKRGKFIDFNYHNVDELAMPPEKVIGSTINDMDFSDYDKEYILKNVNEAIESGELRTIEYKLKLEQGLRYFEARIVPFDENSVLSIVRDSTRIKESEAALRASEERYRLLFRRSPIGICHYNENLVITDLNDKFAEILNSKREELISFNLGELKEEGIINSLESPLRGKFGHFEGEYIDEAKHLKIDLLVKTAPYYTRTGRIKGGICIVEEIRERKNTEKALIRAKELAEKSNKLKTEFLAQMSHEIRTPVNSILSFSTMLKDEVEHKVDEDLQSCFGILENAGKKIIRTIDLLMNISEIQSNSYLYKPVKFDLYKDVLMELFIEFRNLAKEKNLDFEIKVGTDDTHIVADKFSIIQIFSNLLDNAIKFTQHGKVQVKLYRDLSNTLNAAVIDTGVGIEEEVLPSLFEPYTIEEQIYSRKFEGNGLGLLLVKKYCDLNNAKVKVQSLKNKGTTFNITFRDIYSKSNIDSSNTVESEKA